MKKKFQFKTIYTLYDDYIKMVQSYFEQEDSKPYKRLTMSCELACKIELLYQTIRKRIIQ